MTIRCDNPTRKIQIDLRGPEGNAFAILATARDLAKQLGFTKEEKDALTADMMSGGYKHVVDTFEQRFSALVDIYNYDEVFGNAQ